jgi:hypothetical protein
MEIFSFIFAPPVQAVFRRLPFRPAHYAAGRRFFLSYAVLVAALLAAACESGLNGNEYALRPPELPAGWSEVLGEPSWVVDWVDHSGSMREEVCDNLDRIKITPFAGEYTPVSARPFWPEKGIRAGVFYGAGAIFPLDFDGSEIKLSWQGGIDAHFYKLLAAEGNNKRLPNNFDWKRFRELFTTGKIEKEALANPWLADWKSAAKLTAESSFSTSRIKARKRHYLIATIPEGGRWIGTSPFTKPFDWQAEDAVQIAMADDVEFFFCLSGTLRCGRLVYTFRPFPAQEGKSQEGEPEAGELQEDESQDDELSEAD